LTALDILWPEPSWVKTSQYGQTLGGVEETVAPTVTLLVTTGCHFCEDARDELTTRADHGDLKLNVVSIESEQGQALQATHRPSMFPLALLDGKPFSIGRLPRKKLDHALAQLRVR
jgi:Glutaredoxin-like domain (DUF836)